tara:strand:- start:4297 stop:7491 length:3195 start_codon:yes stop_codon:yes gene_type:complete
MALDPKITTLKASGTYRFEFDKSQVVSIPAEQTRLVIGFSKKGPVNTPVFVPDTAFFKQVFGDIDRNLEKKESYFHRSCLTALERGPILALNLLRLDDQVDKVEYLKFLCATAEENIQSNTGAEAKYSGFFNQDKFWFPDTDAFLNNVGYSKDYQASTTNNILDVTNLGKKPISVIVRKASSINTTGFNVTVKEWYGAANVPDYLNGDSLISDFMVDFFIIDGNWGGDFANAPTAPYGRFDSDPTFQTYFNSVKGIQRKVVNSDGTDTKLNQFFNEDEVNLVAQYTACLLPNFVDQLGNNLFIENLVNRDSATTGCFVTVNEKLFDETLLDGVAGGIDMIGHSLEYFQQTGNQTEVNFLSYQEGIDADYSVPENVAIPVDVDPTGIQVTTLGSGDIQLVAANTDPAYTLFEQLTANVAGSTVGSFIQENANSTNWAPVTSVNITPGSVTVVLSGAGTAAANFDPATNPLKYILADELIQNVNLFDGAALTNKIVSTKGSQLYTQYILGNVTNGDEAEYGTAFASAADNYLAFAAINYGYVHTGPAVGDVNGITDSNYNLTAVQVTAYEDAAFTALSSAAEFPGITPVAGSFYWGSDGVAGGANEIVIQSLTGSLNETIDIIASSTNEPSLFPNQVLIKAPNSAVTVGNYLVHDDGSLSGKSRLTRINSVIGGLEPADYPTIPVGETALLVECQSEILVRSTPLPSVELYYPVDEWVPNLNIFTLDGFALRSSYSVPNGTNDRQNEILNDTLSGTNLRKALTDRDVINFRYVVDTFGNGIESGSKAIYFSLCKDRKNALAIVNAPSAEDFKDSTDPKFTDLTGALSTRFISEGGDLSLNPTVRYSLPSVTQGSSFGCFYFPYMTVRDLGRNINVPPAAYVSNNYIDKYATALPWSLVAGVRRGVVGGSGVVGLETNLDKEDREYLEPFGLNPIVFQSGTGPTIFANKTAQQTIKSALSSINCREVVIYIQDGIEAILKNYLFEFNTAQTRLEIKTLADNFLATVQNDDGVFDYKNVMDETNNTPEVIDQNIGILDTYIEPVRGMEILVQRTTILKTGAISAGNFQ